MSVILPASIKDGKLIIDGVEADDVPLSCLGEKPSNGYVIFGKDVCVYVVNTQPDLKEIVSELSEIVANVASVAGQMVVKQVTGQAVGVSFPVDESAKAKLEAIKTKLDEFKFV